MKEEQKEHCSHNFEYSHTETVTLGYGSLNFKKVHDLPNIKPL